ncbi:MAG: hypothetical protein MJ229_04280 [bacterium]|nr:hypothetical protein [bacterium]
MNSRVLISAILSLSFVANPIIAAEFDLSIDDDIRRNYNPNKLVEDMNLPPLPDIEKDIQQAKAAQTKPAKQQAKPVTTPKTQTNTKPNTAAQKAPEKIDDITKSTPLNIKADYNNYQTTNPEQSYAKIKKGTKIKMVSKYDISDRTPKGSRLAFISTYPVTTSCFTIPKGSLFIGEIINSHKPQISGNGGLLTIKITGVLVNNQILPINADVIKTNKRKVFRNNIKGNRKFMANTGKSIKPSAKFSKKMFKASKKCVKKGGFNILLSPFPAALGIVAVAGNTAISPAISLFKKGDGIKLPKGTVFQVKLTQDMYIYK